MFTLGENPIHCMRCNLEIRPEELQLTASMVDSVVQWRDMWGSIYKLWLDSGAYEEWAAIQLTNPASPANQQGIALNEQLAEMNALLLSV